jgi:hypothetical protein
LSLAPGNEQAMMTLSERLTSEMGDIPGFVTEHLYKLDGKENEYLMAVVFADRESYFANARNLRTHELSQQLRALLVADPEWYDGDIVWSYSAGS